MSTETASALFRAGERFSLDHDSPIPLYHQVEEIILERISREKAIGRKLPREMDLIKIFGVSRATVKKTTDSLAAKGLIERKRSAGTRIVRLGVIENLGRLTSFTEQMAKRNLQVSTQVLSANIHRPSATVRKQLQLGSEEKTLCVQRLRGTSEVFPVVLLRSEIPANIGIRADEDFSGSLYSLIESKYGIPIEWADERISAAQVSRIEAEKLDIEAGDTVLVMERLTYTTGDRPLEFVRAVYRPEHYTFSIQLRR